MAETVWIQEDQLTLRHAALKSRSPRDTIILLIESLDWAQRLPHHKQKIVLVWSALRHFADELRQLGYTVDYHTVAREESALAAHIRQFRPRRIRLMQSAEYF
ncbi:MAG: cryptochrome/photolyase family protein, partial [Acidobacteria bacterium]|nr:cryptochrome/photolyase family protein [Acidobacteriota bacterium]